MNIPKKFVMANSFNEYAMELDKNGQYSCNLIGSGFEYGPYSKVQVENFLRSGKFWVKEGSSEFNGVNAQGEKLNFTKDDLKPFMRVTTRNGYQYIVVPYSDGGVALCRQEGWVPAVLDKYSRELTDEGFMIDEVYAAPEFAYQMLDETAKGSLLWKRQELVEENSEFATRLAYLQTHIDAVKENLESLQSEYDQLKKEAHA